MYSGGMMDAMQQGAFGPRAAEQANEALKILMDKHGIDRDATLDPNDPGGLRRSGTLIMKDGSKMEAEVIGRPGAATGTVHFRRTDADMQTDTSTMCPPSEAGGNANALDAVEEAPGAAPADSARTEDTSSWCFGCCKKRAQQKYTTEATGV
eukprot:TRINITY_DN34200_c0_g1_i1.p2 TRINITY_DN34200_c0_g1~~TRINITY_DN34200_c0_g1_i1.p2  ORF type:complete len:152 (+),score=35.76 TRINITY_DN34200_c0_g1_i1:20-475(+)